MKQSERERAVCHVNTPKKIIAPGLIFDFLLFILEGPIKTVLQTSTMPIFLFAILMFIYFIVLALSQIQTFNINM